MRAAAAAGTEIPAAAANSNARVEASAMSFRMARVKGLFGSFPVEAGRSGIFARVAFACAIAAPFMFLPQSFADPNYIENLTFSAPSPGSARANSFESVLRLDANDASFAAAAGWGGGYTSWQQQFDHTKQLVAASPDAGLVFIGDSLAQNWGNVGGRLVNGVGAGTWNSAQYNFDQYDALNLGIAGDQTQNVIYRINRGQLNGITPGLVVLMVGTNNLYAPTGNPGFPVADYVGPAHTAEETADGVLATVQAIHARLPNAHILAISVLRGLNNSDPDRIAADTVNGLLADAFNSDTNPLLHFRDISHCFRNPDGSLNNRMGSDGVHLTAAGYEVWAEEIEPHVSQFATTNPLSLAGENHDIE